MSLSDLYPLKSGKYITYRVDSLVFVNAGKLAEVHRYRVKHVIDHEVTDNLNRPAWLVYTYINDSLGNGPWVSNGTYIITPVDKQVEVYENNLRVIKLQQPALEGFTWNGNSHLPLHPFNPDFPMSVDLDMNSWKFNYTSINQQEKIGTTQIDSITTVTHVDESTNLPLVIDTVYATRELSLEKYAKNIGLVYREFELWENQPRRSGTDANRTYNPVRIGFGIKMWMVDRN
ncbi:MAG: hypothetical protein QM725_08765 [Lacibacter sp.]